MSVNEKMTAIADAIRAKTGGMDKLTLDAMVNAIEGIQSNAGGGAYDFSGFLNIDEIASGTFVPAYVNSDIYIYRPSLNHVPRIMVAYSEDDVNTLIGTTYASCFTMYLSSNSDPFTESTENDPKTTEPFMIQLGASKSSISHSAFTGSGEKNKGYGLCGYYGVDSVYSALHCEKKSRKMKICPFKGSTSSSSYRIWAPGAVYKYMIGDEVMES